MSSGLHMSRFEAKDLPIQPPETKIVEAYGLGKCPKLVKQIAGEDLEVRINALAVLCEEFENPYSIEGCARAGVIGVLSKMIKDPDFTTRVRATKALAIAAGDANGLASILEDEQKVLPHIVEGVEDPSDVVRGNVYTCLFNLTRTMEGVQACVRHLVPNAFVHVLKDEVDSLKPTLLKALHNIVGDAGGQSAAIESNAVGVCIKLLQKSADVTTQYSPHEPEILTQAARTLGFMCYEARAKEEALEKEAVMNLVRLLKGRTLTQSAKLSITIALMAITSTSTGKIQVHTNEGTESIIALLYDDSKVVILNALKIISNIAVYPLNREILMNDTTCVAKLKRLSKFEDKLVAKHAAIALAAVSWTP